MPFYYSVALIFFWCLVWVIYNKYLKERRISNPGQILIALFFAVSAALVLHFYQDFLPELDTKLAYVVAAVFVLDMLLKRSRWKFKFIVSFRPKDTLYLTSTIFNVLFQQSVINVIIVYLHTFFSVNITILVFTIFFGILHSPLLFMRHVHDREMDVIGSFILGLLSSYLILNFSLGYIYAFLVHYSFYLVYSLTIKNEALI